MMRIITGKAKGVRLITLEGEATRPTAERVKEAIFSSLQFDIEGRRVLDLFAGSGQMGLEAMSRGALSVMFIDASREAMDVVKQNAAKVRVFDECRYLVSDYRNYIRKASEKEKFDIVFLDPPYSMHAIPDAVTRLYDADLLARGATLVCESEEDIFLSEPRLAERFDSVKSTRYGRIFINIIRLKDGDE